MVAPKHPPPLKREQVDPAPWMDKDERCSDCGVKAVPAGEGLYKVCPHCFGVLWSLDRSAEHRAARAAAQAAVIDARSEAAIRRREIFERKQRLRPPRNLTVENLTVSSPVFDTPENEDDQPD